MFLTVHATAGTAVGNNLDSVILAFILGFFSHFLLDFIPHGEELKAGIPKDQVINKLIKMFCIDFVIMCLVLTFIYFTKPITNYYTVLAAVFGAILPDFIVGISELKPNHFSWFKNFHHKFHAILNKKIKFHLVYGIIFQAIILCILYIFI